MSKLQEYELSKLGQELVDFADDVRDLVNNGKQAFPVVSAVPDWTANQGEMAFYSVLSPLTDRRIYIRLESSWIAFSQSSQLTETGGLSRFLAVGSALIFSTPGEATWTYPATNVSLVWVRCWGAGGGAGNGGALVRGGAGGGGGGYAESIVAVSSDVTVTVGGAGAGAVANGAGGTGGFSSFGTTFVRANGGAGGASTGGAGGVGGGGINGIVLINGQAGSVSANTASPGGFGGQAGIGGAGGNGGGPFGSGNGNAGSAPGGGGGGGGAGASNNGGAGADGLVIVMW